MATSNYTSKDEIPYGYCHCGCGQKTKIAKKTSTRDKTRKGEPMQFVSRHQKYIQLWERFWSKVLITADGNQCWLWTSSNDGRRGYGHFNINGKPEKANRIAWQYPNYVIPDGLFVLHSCDNPRCCNPKHLFLGTHQDNMDDMLQKGRKVVTPIFGKRHGLHKLTMSQVKEIREQFATGKYSKAELARSMNVDPKTIANIINNVIWKTV